MLDGTGIGVANLLEEHESRTNESSAPASFLEQVNPSNDFKLDPVADCTLLKLWMFLGANLSVQSNFGADVEPLTLDSAIGNGKLAQS
jgi:hypothetical protein